MSIGEKQTPNPETQEERTTGKGPMSAQTSLEQPSTASTISMADTISTTTDMGDTRDDTEPEDGYPIGTTLIARWMDGTEKICDVIDKKKSKSKPYEHQYYVHWHDFNRRMDEWISPKDIVRKGTDEESNKLQDKHLKDKEVEKEEGKDGDKTAAGRKRKRKAKEKKEEEEHDHDEHDEHEGMDAASIREHEEVTKVKNVRCVEMGKYRMSTWYFSPFPKEYFPDGHVDCLYFCEFCMQFFRHKDELRYHYARQACDRHPPGNEIYRHDGVAVFEVDGAISKVFCQNLCFFAKLFLDHKTLYYDVDPFLFYIICEVDNRGFHPVGYFSKEKYSELGYNLACILTFPCHQKKGYGSFIISFSYELSKKEEKVGSPEKPLSDLGLLSYRSYWTRVLLQTLKDTHEEELSIMDLARLTSIKTDDIISTLQLHGIIKYFNGQYIMVASPEVIAANLKKPSKGAKVNPDKLHWTPLQLDVKRDKWALKSKIPTADE